MERLYDSPYLGSQTGYQDGSDGVTTNVGDLLWDLHPILHTTVRLIMTHIQAVFLLEVSIGLSCVHLQDVH